MIHAVPEKMSHSAPNVIYASNMCCTLQALLNAVAHRQAHSAV